MDLLRCCCLLAAARSLLGAQAIQERLKGRREVPDSEWARVNERLRVEGIPKSFVYDREGKPAAQSTDMRTGKQFLEMLSRAGLR